MKIIPPYQITSEILNLINESEKYLVLVSPYVNFKNWDRIKTDLLNSIKRGVKIEFYTRLDNENFKSWEQIEQLGLTPKLIKNLHAKLYFNEKSGIVTSMNLLTSSNLNAIEFGSIYHTEQELNELKGFIKKHLEPNLEISKPNDEDLYLAKEKFDIILTNYLSNYLKRHIYCKWQNGVLNINANNQYYLAIDKIKNVFSISGIISGNENLKFDNFIQKNQHNIFNQYELFVSGEKGMIGSAVLLSKKQFSSSNLNFLSVSEKKEILLTTLNFINELTIFKDEIYQRRKANY